MAIGAGILIGAGRRARPAESKSTPKLGKGGKGARIGVARPRQENLQTQFKVSTLQIMAIEPKPKRLPKS